MSASLEQTAPLGVQTTPPEEQEGEVHARGYWEGVWFRLKRDKLAVFSGVFIVFLFAAAFGGAPLASYLLGHGPDDIFFNAVKGFIPVGPWTHVSTSEFGQHGGAQTLFILGAANQLGQDLFLRILYGAQPSLEVGVFSTIGSVGLGVIMGLLAGYFRGWMDTVVSRLIEIVMVFPALLFIIAVRIVAGPSLDHITLGFLPDGVFMLVVIFTMFGWFYPARIMRGVVFSLREKEFIEAARMTGASDWRIMRAHLLPHLVAPIVVYSSILVASNILGEAGLSFLGLGLDPGQASWGTLLAEAPSYYQTQVWILVFPGLAILLTTIAFNLLGDGLRDAFDPRARI